MAQHPLREYYIVLVHDRERRSRTRETLGAGVCPGGLGAAKQRATPDRAGICALEWVCACALHVVSTGPVVVRLAESGQFLRERVRERKSKCRASQSVSLTD